MTLLRYYLLFDDDWELSAACRDADDPDLWHPSKQEPQKREEAKAICAGCDVRMECLVRADERDERHGIWGGLTRPERVQRRQTLAQIQGHIQPGAAA